jgi:nucleotide-binding universal stress UspA family protein
MNRPSVLCPIDFSHASRGALRYAAVLAEHFYATLSVLAVDDPFLVQAATASFGAAAMQQLTEDALQSFLEGTFPAAMPRVAELKLQIRVGEAAPEILRAADAEKTDVIVMSTHGTSGLRKRLFGSTTERVLRDTTVPVVVTPGSDPGPESVETWMRAVRSVLVPVDMSECSPHQLRVAQGLAEGIGAAVVLAHVLEPLVVRDQFSGITAAVDAVRQASARTRLDELLRDAPSSLRRASEITYGDPASEIARLAREHAAGAIVMALHSSPETGRRIGSVTYRLLCQTPAVVIALPPAPAAGPLPIARGAYAASAAAPSSEVSP